MKPVDVTDSAADDLLELVRFALNFSTVEAERIVTVFESVLRDLREFPELGTPLAGLRERSLSRGRLRFVYETDDEKTTVVQVLDPRRDRSSP